MPDPVTDLALRLLNQPIDSIPRYRLLRDVLHEDPSSSHVKLAREDAMSSPHVIRLAEQQGVDGSWGPLQRDSSALHETMPVTASRSVSKAVRTTEHALQRAVWLGMDRQHPAIEKALVYLVSHLSVAYRDTGNANTNVNVAKRVTTQDRSARENVAKRDTTQDGSFDENVAKRDIPVQRMSHSPVQKMSQSDVAKRDLLLAAQILQFDESNPFAGLVADRWKRVLTAAFADGTYSELRYLESYGHVFGHSAEQNQNLAFSRPVLMLMRGLLPYPIEEAYTRYLMEEVRGIVGVHHRALHHLPLDFPSLESMRFLSAVELLAAYPSAETLLEETKAWLWEQMSPTGRWDLGKFGHDGVCLPLSASWRRPFDRQVDSTVRMLLLLQNMQISCDLRQNLCHTR